MRTLYALWKGSICTYTAQHQSVCRVYSPNIDKLFNQEAFPGQVEHTVLFPAVMSLHGESFSSYKQSSRMARVLGFPHCQIIYLVLRKLSSFSLISPQTRLVQKKLLDLRLDTRHRLCVRAVFQQCRGEVGPDHVYVVSKPLTEGQFWQNYSIRAEG